MNCWAWLSFFLVCVSAFGQPQDSFEKLGLTVRTPTASVEDMKEGQGLKVLDRWGNSLVAFPSDSAMDNQGAVSFSEFYSAVGLFHVPYWPALIHTYPETQDLTETISESEARWKLAKLTPMDQLQAKALPDSEAPWEVIETRAILRWLDYGLRSDGRSELWSGDHLLADTPTHHFSYLRENPSQLHLRYFAGNSFPWRRLAVASPEEVESLLNRLNPILDRVEAIAESHVEAVFGPLFLAATVPYQDERITAIILAEIRASLTQLRSDIQSHLTKKVRGSFKSVDLMKAKKKARVVVPPLAFGKGFRDRWPSLQDPYFVNSHARQLLYIYMASPTHERVNALAQWMAETGEPEPLHLLVQAAAHNDGSTRWIAGDLPLKPSVAKPAPASTTFFLNPEARRNLIVFSDVDAEGKQIAELLAKLPSSHKVASFTLSYRNGTKLGADDMQSLLKIFDRQNHSRLVLCELGGLPPEVRERLQEEKRYWAPGDSFVLEDDERKGKPPILIIDHHESAQTSWQKRSSLEQLMLYLGYQPEMEQVMAGIVDRSGLSGLSELGMSHEEVKSYLANRVSSGRLTSLTRLGEESAANPHKFFWVTDSNYSFADVSRATGLAAYPEIPKFVLVTGAKVFVQARPRLIDSLMNAEWAKDLNPVLGGDGRNSAYLVLRLPSNPVESNRVLHSLRLAIEELEKSCRELVLGK